MSCLLLHLPSPSFLPISLMRDSYRFVYKVHNNTASQHRHLQHKPGRTVQETAQKYHEGRKRTLCLNTVVKKSGFGH